jgi:hypothetical protein
LSDHSLFNDIIYMSITDLLLSFHT